MNSPPKNMRLLLVEDNPGDARLVQELLVSCHHVKIVIVTSLLDAIQLLQAETFRVVLLDLNLPDSSGLETLESVVQYAPTTPIIVLTGMDNENTGLAAIQAGAQDYIPKSELNQTLLQRAIRYGLERMEQRRNLHGLLEHNQDPTIVISQTGEIYYANETLNQLPFRKEFLSLVKRLLQERHDELSVRHEREVELGGYEPRTYTLRMSPFEWGVDTASLLISLHDITESKQVQSYLEVSNSALQSLVAANAETLRLSSKILETMAEGVIVTDADKRIAAINPAFTRLTGYSVVDVVGQQPNMLQSGLHGKKFYEAMQDELRKYGHWEGELWNRHKDGHLYCVQESINVICQPDGCVSHYISILRDITERVKREKVILDQALHDALTGLANRSLLKETLEQNILLARRKGYKVGILFIDIDNFKRLNDQHGHVQGDKILCEIAERMRRCARASDLVARLGGDEFVVVLPGVAGLSDVESATQHITDALEKPYQGRGELIDISFSIGISVWPDNGKDYEDLMRQADFAMYEVKRNGKGSWRMA